MEEHVKYGRTLLVSEAGAPPPASSSSARGCRRAGRGGLSLRWLMTARTVWTRPSAKCGGLPPAHARSRPQLPAHFVALPRPGRARVRARPARAGIAYGLVSVAFVWELLGALLGAPDWLLDLTPFTHVGLVPSQPFRVAAALAMLAIAAAVSLAALWCFDRRDLADA